MQKKQNITLHGILKMNNGEPIANGLLGVDDACKGVSTTVKTVQDGSFEYITSAPCAGIYQVQFSFSKGEGSTISKALVSVDNNAVIAAFRTAELENTIDAPLRARVSIDDPSVLPVGTPSSKEFDIPAFTTIVIADGSEMDYVPELLNMNSGRGKLVSRILLLSISCVRTNLTWYHFALRIPIIQRPRCFLSRVGRGSSLAYTITPYQEIWDNGRIGYRVAILIRGKVVLAVGSDGLAVKTTGTTGTRFSYSNRVANRPK